MGTYTGTVGADEMRPGYLSPGVTANPPGTTPGDMDDVLYGNGGNDLLTAGEGFDTLSGGEGNDVLAGWGPAYMNGGGDDDLYIVDDLGDVVAEDDTSAAGGVDTIRSYISFTLGDGFENLELTGGLPIDGTGNELDNKLVGSQASNTLHGLDGDDTLLGQQGNDTLVGSEGEDILDGGEGADLLKGGSGDDLYYLDDPGDLATEDRSDAAGGQDTVRATVSCRLSRGIETLILEGQAGLDGTGNALDNTLRGTTGGNLLQGLGGADTLKGLAGADELQGQGGQDRLLGQDGRDELDGGQGRDKLTGGTGSDEFLFAAPGQGGDTITDFRDAKGNNDRLLIDASGFKGGLEAGGHLSAAQFQTGDDHQARDSDICFLFDTRDETLWFDRNGDKAGGLTLVADLQASAQVTHDDIWLI